MICSTGGRPPPPNSWGQARPTWPDPAQPPWPARRTPPPAELLGPGAADVAGAVAARLPRTQHLHAIVERPWKVGRGQSIPREERPDLLLQRALRGRGLELHEVTSYQFFYRCGDYSALLAFSIVVD